MALCIVIRNVELASTVTYFIDNQATADTFYKGLGRAILAVNADLYVEMFEQIRLKHLHVEVYWMPSHTLTDKKIRNKQSC